MVRSRPDAVARTSRCAIADSNRPHCAGDALDIVDPIGRPQKTTIVNRPGLTKVLRHSTKLDATASAFASVRASIPVALATLSGVLPLTACGKLPPPVPAARDKVAQAKRVYP